MTKVATQGREVASYRGYNQFVTMYALSYSNDQTTWTDYVGDDSCTKVQFYTLALVRLPVIGPGEALPYIKVCAARVSSLPH